MLKPFAFRIRNRGRDQQNDAERIGRLVALIDETIAQVGLEQDGLDRRYKASQSDAALLMMASDNDDVQTDRANARLTTLESTIIACENRLKELGAQKDMLSRMRTELGSLVLSTSAV